MNKVKCIALSYPNSRNANLNWPKDNKLSKKLSIDGNNQLYIEEWY